MSVSVDIHLYETDDVSVAMFDDPDASFAVLYISEHTKLYVAPESIDILIDAATKVKRHFEGSEDSTENPETPVDPNPVPA